MQPRIRYSLKLAILFVAALHSKSGIALSEYDPSPGSMCFSDQDIVSASQDYYPASNGYSSPGENISMMQTPLPPNNAGIYPSSHQYYPGSSFATSRYDLIQSRWLSPQAGSNSNKQFYFLWVNRCADIDGNGSCPNTNKYKGNYYYIDPGNSIYPGYQDVAGGILKPDLPDQQGVLKPFEIRPQFTSVEKADGCTRLNLGRALGFPTSYLNNISQRHGLFDTSPGGQITYRYHEMQDIVQNWQALVSSPVDKGNQRYYFFKDRCVLTPKLDPNRIQGVVLDWEVQDHRSIQQTKTLINRARQVLNQKSKDLVLFTNSLSNVNAVKANGFISQQGGQYNYSTLRHIKQTVDYFSPIVWSGATPGNPARGLPARNRQIQLNGSTVSWDPVTDLEYTLDMIDDAMGWNGSSARDYTNILPFVSLFDTTLTESLTLRNRRKTKGLAGYGIWRNFVKQDGSCQKSVQASPSVGTTMSNQVIACLSMSNCSGLFNSGSGGGNPPPTNAAPQVNAGANTSVLVGAAVTLSGTVTDDGLPTSTLSPNWTALSGPGSVTFGTSTSLATMATFTVAGTYVLQLVVSDSVLSTSDTLQVVVSPAVPINSAPVVSAGQDATITIGSGINLNGSVSDDGLPNNQLTSNWNAVSGTGTVTFSNPGNINTSATFSSSGTYVLELAASDGSLSTSDFVQITVNSSGNAGGGNVPQVVLRINAGGPQILGDADGNWLADNTNASTFANTGKIYSKNSAINMSAVPAYVPSQIFISERWDRGAAPDLKYQIPVTPGNYEVRLYFAEIYAPMASVGKRVFDVEVEGQQLSSLDVFSEVGFRAALMKSFVVASDAQLDIELKRISQNPAIKGIEIIGL